MSTTKTKNAKWASRRAELPCSESYFAVVIGRPPRNRPYFRLRRDDKGRMIPHLFESRTEASEHAPHGSRVVRVDVIERIPNAAGERPLPAGDKP